MVSWNLEEVLLDFGLTAIDIGMLEFAMAIGGRAERSIILGILIFEFAHSIRSCGILLGIPYFVWFFIWFFMYATYRKKMYDDAVNEEFFDDEVEMNMKRSLAPEIINSIPALKIGSDTMSSPYFSKNDFCLICWENFIKGEVVKELYPCGHIFHGACIDKWLGQANYCAYCQRVVSLQPYLPWCLHQQVARPN
ncbi:hypothetical protein AMTR_s00109p00112000 [Amborella trichopoda]|uniref:RING-type domain-containing protein n=1 Tax=Amborella trichopoda TaxID=13333 RepID=W1NTY2_AMBTC|nr:hypothetical protein AMTR_s00109p00112000 [Amborella trichopoda]